MKNAHNSFFGKPEGTRPLGRSRRRWKDIIGTYLEEIGWKVIDWMHLAQDRNQWLVVLCTVMKLRVP
jgi:hypothetical protein